MEYSHMTCLARLRLVRLLREHPAASFDEDALWQCVLRGEEKTPNNQMDVVLSLWSNGFIETGVDEAPAPSGW